jgi:tetratricopeptide (TPR) repeat protein
LCLNSNLAEAWSFSGWVKNWLGEPEAAIERFARAMRLSPLDPSLRIPSGTAHAHFFLGRYDEAASWAAMALQDNADYQPGLRIAAAAAPRISLKRTPNPNREEPRVRYSGPA